FFREVILRSILLVDATDTTAVVDLLSGSDFTVTVSRSVTQALDYLQKEHFDLLITETSLPDKTGFFLIRFLRKKLGQKKIPVIILTTRKATKFKVHGLKIGANDYITKPFVYEEFLARVHVQMRILSLIENTSDTSDRKKIQSSIMSRPDYFFGPFRLNYQQVVLYKNDEKVPLTFQEFKLLVYLIDHKNQPVSKDEILDRLWKYEVGSRTIYTHMSWLREKLKCEENPEGYIKTVRQIGYMFEVKE
ncbi:MAG: response regulator transcription factor, partial [Spirochaetaceae bacterium]|nr:response regulator transcription factor [Spirochaetaceae bacterium]